MASPSILHKVRFLPFMGISSPQGISSPLNAGTGVAVGVSVGIGVLVSVGVWVDVAVLVGVVVGVDVFVGTGVAVQAAAVCVAICSSEGPQADVVRLTSIKTEIIQKYTFR